MKERLRILPMKILAAFSLLMGMFPAFILPGQYLMPNDPAIWYALPGIAFCFGILGYLFPGKLRMVFPILGGALLTACIRRFPARERLSVGCLGPITFSSFLEASGLPAIGRKLFPSDQPSVSRR